MNELKPCPFCGGEAITMPHFTDSPLGKRVLVACAESGLGTDHGAWTLGDTEAEAITAWNTRTERTCKISFIGDDHGETVSAWYRCANCGNFMLLPKEPNYCPNCGAKVVSE